ncbi:MAG: hypothetical protein HQ559_01320 [Lentisphaerae bacterium]|nr:hypothetical protein [Lentisphaerota bacterium]
MTCSLERVVEDWDGVKKRWEAWWECELHDRVLMCVTAPRNNVSPPDLPAVNTRSKWTDIDYMVRRTRETSRTTWHGGEKLPTFVHYWSVGHALPFGCEPQFNEDTIWAAPAPVGSDGYPTFDGWREPPWWTWMLEATEKAVLESRGEYFVLPMWGNDAVDNLAVIRGTEQLLMDIAENPGWVTDAVDTLSDIFMEMYRELRQRVDRGRDLIEGSVTGQGCWTAGTAASFDCDTAAMVSPDVFQGIFLPPLVRTMRTVDRRVYHFDGACALQHMDAVLDTPEIHAIQWLPGAGREEIMQWVPVIERIQAKGKAVLVYVTPDEVAPLLREVRPEGLCINTHCPTEDEGRGLLDSLSK